MTHEELKALGEQIAQKALAGITLTQGEVQILSTQMKAMQDDVALVKSRLAISLPGVNDEKAKWSWARAIKGITTNAWEDAGFEREVFMETRKKAMSTGTGGAGGFLVPIEFAKDLIQLIYANTVLDKMGVTRINATSSPVEIPRIAGGATAYWVGENTAITASQQTIEQMILSPKMVAGLVKTSVRLVNQSDFSVEQMIMNDIARQIALSIDLKAFNGDGTSNTPVGILNTAGVITHNPGSTSGDVASYDLFLDMEGKLEDANTLQGSLGYAMNPKVARMLKKQKTPNYAGQTDGAPVFAPIVNDTILAERLGYKFSKSTQIPVSANKSAVYFGNFADLVLAQWGGLSLETSTQAGDSTGGAFSSHQVWFKVVAEIDFGLRHPESFVVAPLVQTA